MDCRECSSEMTAFMDGELSQSRRAEVRSHIDSCPACAREMSDLREAVDFVRAHHRQLDLQPAGWSRVLVHLESAGKTRGFGWLTFGFARWQPVAIALTGFGLMIAAWSYQRHAESRRALERYMIQYVQAREAQERLQGLPGRRETVVGSVNPETGNGENPFLPVRQTTEENPFRR